MHPVPMRLRFRARTAVAAILFAVALLPAARAAEPLKIGSAWR